MVHEASDARARTRRGWGGVRRRWDRRRRVLVRERLGLVALCVSLGAGAFPARAPAGTVAEQRARLPPPATCQDNVEGLWQSHDYDERWSEWTIFTLEIHRDDDEPSKLTGRILNHSWIGPEDQTEPGPCKGRLRFKISMDAEGRVDESGHIQFGGIGTWRMDEVICGVWDMGYNLDNFSGTIDPEILEFQSVNNDGGRAVNDPTVFRRVKCWDEPGQDDEPEVVVAPPPFYPPQEQREGWGCLVSR